MSGGRRLARLPSDEPRSRPVAEPVRVIDAEGSRGAGHTDADAGARIDMPRQARDKRGPASGRGRVDEDREAEPDQPRSREPVLQFNGGVGEALPEHRAVNPSVVHERMCAEQRSATSTFPRAAPGGKRRIR